MQDWFQIDHLIAIVFILAAVVLAAIRETKKWDADKSLSVVIWLLVSFFATEYAVRIFAIQRIEHKLDLLLSNATPVELLHDPADIWIEASKLLQSSNITIVETTSLRNATEYEAKLRRASEDGAVVTRYICAPPDVHLGDLIDVPPRGTSLASRLRHIPSALPLDCLIAGSTDAPKVIIGLRPPAGGGNYESGLRINDPAAALRFKSLMERELERLASAHSDAQQDCRLCREIQSLR